MDKSLSQYFYEKALSEHQEWDEAVAPLLSAAAAILVSERGFTTEQTSHWLANAIASIFEINRCVPINRVN